MHTSCKSSEKSAFYQIYCVESVFNSIFFTFYVMQNEIICVTLQTKIHISEK